jgi:outer membrane biosynthesis protein TonB
MPGTPLCCVTVAGSMKMTKQASQYRLGHVDPFDENTADPRTAPHRLPADAYPEEESVPLFLSDYNREPDPSEYLNPLRKKRRASISSLILAAVLAAAASAVLFALISADATRAIVVNVKASIAAVLPAPSVAAQSDLSQLKQVDSQLNEPPPPSAPENQTVGLRSVTTPAVAPTREEIKTAYQGALQDGAPRAAAVAEPTIPGDAIHQLDPNEIASSLRRADALIASGDLAAARLVLRRAADAGDARAAMMLAETYDPAILEKLGVHGIMPDLAMARGWYEKAKKFGATEATQRLELLASKQH